MVGWRDVMRHGKKVYNYLTFKCHAPRVLAHGTCSTNRVHQDVILREVAGLIRASFTNPDRVRELRAEVEELARRQADAGDGERQVLRDRIAELDRHLAKGTQRLLLCPEGQMARATAALKQWQDERDQLARDLARAESAAKAGDAFTARVTEALFALQNLEEAIAEAPPDVARDLLGGLVDKVTLHFRHGKVFRDGRRRRTTLTALEVALRPDVAELLGTGRTVKSPVGYWKQFGGPKPPA
jgi:hypothetical protein